MVCQCGFKMKPKKVMTMITKEEFNIGMYCRVYMCNQCNSTLITKRERNRMTKVFDREAEKIKRGEYNEK